MRTLRRYLLKQLLKTYALFVFGFFALWVLIDYSIHLKHFLNASHWKTVVVYYGMQFCANAPLILGFGLTLAILHTLAMLALKRQQVTLWSIGIDTSQLLNMPRLLAAGTALLLFLNFTFLVPKFDPGWSNASETFFYYDKFDPATQTYSHVFWMSPEGTLYQMRDLVVEGEEATGHFVQAIDPFTNQIDRQETLTLTTASFLEPKAHTSLGQVFYQLTTPLLLALLPFCFVRRILAFQRNPSLFLLYSSAIATLLFAVTCQESCFLLAESAHIYWPLFVPLGLVLIVARWQLGSALLPLLFFVSLNSELLSPLG